MANELAKKETVTTPMELLQMAVQQGADVDKLTKLMDLKDRYEANEAKKAYVEAMAKFRDEVPAIPKTRKAHNSMYAGLAETLAKIKESMGKNGLSHSWKTSQGEENSISVTCCVTHVLGHTECTTLGAFPDTSGSKNSIQAIGSTVTYLERYTLFALLGLASVDQDDDGGGTAKFITEDQAADLKAKAEEVGADEKGFLKYMGAESYAKIPANQFQKAVNALNAKAKQVKK